MGKAKKVACSLDASTMVESKLTRLRLGEVVILKYLQAQNRPYSVSNSLIQAISCSGHI